MAKQRYVNTKFWNDAFISHLDPLERYLFLYFLTNEHTNIAGIYELPLRTMAFETGIESEMLIKMIGKMKEKIIYTEEWVCIKNFIKHQSTTSVKVQQGISLELKNVPPHIIDVLIGYGYHIHRSNEGIIYSNSNSNSNTNTVAKAKKRSFNPLGEQIIKAFEGIDPKNKTYYGNITQRSACDFLIEEYTIEKVLELVPHLPEINQQKLYIGQITTPYELKLNWVKLANSYYKLKKQETKII